MEEQRRRAKLKNFILGAMFCQYCSILLNAGVQFVGWIALEWPAMFAKPVALFITLHRVAAVMMKLSW